VCSRVQHTHACVCVCVRVWERTRERERDECVNVVDQVYCRVWHTHNVCRCVWESENERKSARERKRNQCDWSSLFSRVTHICMCVCACVRVCARYECVHVLDQVNFACNTHTHTHMCVCVCAHACMWVTWVCACGWSSLFLCATHTLMCMYVRACVCVCVCVCVCACVCVTCVYACGWSRLFLRATHTHTHMCVAIHSFTVARQQHCLWTRRVSSFICDMATLWTKHLSAPSFSKPLALASPWSISLSLFLSLSFSLSLFLSFSLSLSLSPSHSFLLSRVLSCIWHYYAMALFNSMNGFGIWQHYAEAENGVFFEYGNSWSNVMAVYQMW